MPTYQYRCINDHSYEEQRSIHEHQKQHFCPECNMVLKPRFSVPAINLVGKGFYSNGG
jgi:putative FmdB family regulatory protein